MSKLDKDQVIADFTAAYKAANGKDPQIEAKSGWYSVDGGKNIRLAQLVDMTAELSGGAAKEEAPAEKVEAKAEEKPAAKKEAPAKKAAPKKKAAVTFSVKQWWNEQLDTNNPGSILPR